MPSAISNVEPTLVTLRSGSDAPDDPISAHVALGDSLVIRDPGGDGTARPNQRLIPASEQTVLGENIGFVMPATNMAGEFEVLTLTRESTSDCTGGMTGIYDGLAIGQADVLQLTAGSGASTVVTIRGTSGGAPLRPSTTVTLSTTRGEFAAVNDLEIAPSKVVQLTLTAGPPVEGAAVGTVLWRTGSDRAGPATMTATAMQDGFSLFKSVTASILPPPLAADAGFTGTLPGAGLTALLVTSRTFATADLATAIDAAGCKPLSIATLVDGTWAVYVPGAPELVNVAFPGTLPADTPFVLRCG